MREAEQERSVLEIIALFKSKAFAGASYKDYTATSGIDAMAKADKINQNRTKTIADSMLILDENINWLMSVTDTLMVMVISTKRQKKKWKASLVVLAGALSQLIAMKRLLLSGLG